MIYVPVTCLGSAMPCSDFLAWLSTAKLKISISDFDAVKSKFGLLLE